MNKLKNNPPTPKEHIVAYLEIMDCENKMQNPQDSDLLLAQLISLTNTAIPTTIHFRSIWIN